jgi:HTH-type transcriptional regulator / antitoxin HipB
MRTHGQIPWAAQLAGAVRTRRKGLKLTQAELAALAGCGTAFLHALENGKPSVRLDKVIDVLEVLGLRLELRRGGGGIVVEEGGNG